MGGASQGRWDPEAKLGRLRYGVPPWLSPNVRFGLQFSPTITFSSVFRGIFVPTSSSLLEVLFRLLLLLPFVTTRSDISLHANGLTLNRLCRHHTT